MRRAVPALVITMIGLGALASFKSAPSAATKPAAGAIAPRRTTPPTTAPPPPGTVPPTGLSPTTTPPTTAGATRTVDGDPVDNPYGTVQVRVTLQGNTITAVTALQMPFDRERSQYISQQAEPYLRQEALQAQSAQIDLVSGATYTSYSYAQSLQSALDKAHA
jgi:uncharacterized protein with FMN-binding domain